MPFFLAKASVNEAVIIERYGTPWFATLRYAIIPFPCCCSARRFNVGLKGTKFQVANVYTKDDKRVTLNFAVKFCVNTNSELLIMRAYNSSQQSMGRSSSGSRQVTAFRYDENTVRQVSQYNITNVITDIVKKKTLKITLEELHVLPFLFVDVIHSESVNTLKEMGIQLKQLNLEEVKDLSHKRSVMFDRRISGENGKKPKKQRSLRSKSLGAADKDEHNPNIQNEVVSSKVADVYGSIITSLSRVQDELDIEIKRRSDQETSQSENEATSSTRHQKKSNITPKKKCEQVANGNCRSLPPKVLEDPLRDHDVRIDLSKPSKNKATNENGIDSMKTKEYMMDSFPPNDNKLIGENLTTISTPFTSKYLKTPEKKTKRKVKTKKDKTKIDESLFSNREMKEKKHLFSKSKKI